MTHIQHGKKSNRLLACALIATAIALLSAAFFRHDTASRFCAQPRAANSPIRRLADLPTRRLAQLHERLPARRDADYWPQQAHPVALLRRDVLPALSMSGADLQDAAPRVWLVQFGGPLEDADKRALKRRNLEALSPGAEMTCYVRASAGALTRASQDFSPAILGWVRLEAADKIVSNGKPLAAFPMRMRIELHPGGAPDATLKTALAAGAKILKRGADWLEVASTGATSGTNLALELAALDDVYAIEAGRPKFTLHNEEAAANSNVTPLLGPPYNLNGSGITVMVRDEGRIFSHSDLAGRLQFAADVASQQPVQHATHVAGTIGGTGMAIPGVGARGFATACGIVSYDLNGDETAEVRDAHNQFGAVLSNHSYGFATGWDNGVFIDNQSTFGIYSTFARNWDGLVRSDAVIIVKSAGNDRADNGPGHPHDGTLAADGEYYNCTDQSATGKNILVVGAVTDAAHAGTASTTQFVTAFSSSGPTADGRLRPEISANGDTLTSCDNTPVTGNTYVSLSGTSMAAAAVSGASALFLQRYKQRFGLASFCAPHYLRAIYAQTATDFGREGPDYLHGFGMLDLAAAIALFEADAGTLPRLPSDMSSSALPEHWYALSSDGIAPIKATLCWTDDAGDMLAKKALVNDLDLRLVRADDQSIVRPFILDPANPQNPATQGINQVDTIEQLVLKAPRAGSYLLAVRGATLIAPVAFTLASSHGLAEDKPPVPLISTSGNSGAPPFVVNFDGSGSSDPDGTVASYLWSFGDGTSASGATVTHSYLGGTFQAALTVIDNAGASASTSVTISVQDNPPTVSLEASPRNGPVPLSVMFSSAGSVDADGSIAAFNWDFGDGTSGSGPQIAHTYTAPGLYWPQLTLIDNGGKSASKSIGIFAGSVFPTSSARFALNFAKNGLDSFSISTSKLPVDAALNPSGLSGSVRIGKALFNFSLDAKGAFRSTVLNVKFTPKQQRLNIVLRKTSLQDALGGAALLNVDGKNQTLSAPFAFILNNGLGWGAQNINYLYSSKKGATGSGRLLK